MNINSLALLLSYFSHYLLHHHHHFFSYTTFFFTFTMTTPSITIIISQQSLPSLSSFFLTLSWLPHHHFFFFIIITFIFFTITAISPQHSTPPLLLKNILFKTNVAWRVRLFLFFSYNKLLFFNLNSNFINITVMFLYKDKYILFSALNATDILL
jgi:hypothetical protein